MYVSTLRLRRKLEELTGSCAWIDCSCGGESTPAEARYSSSVLIVPSERLTCAGSDIVFREIKKLYQVLLPRSCTLGGGIYTYLRSISKTWKRGMTSTFRTVHVTYSCQTTYPLPHILPRQPQYGTKNVKHTSNFHNIIIFKVCWMGAIDALLSKGQSF
jgi:hypothetical protein